MGERWLNQNKLTSANLLQISPPIPSNPSAKIEKIWVDYNILENNLKGMKIHTMFNAKNLGNKTCTAAAYFYFAHGRALQDYNQQYHSSDGKVCSYIGFTPANDNFHFNDLSIFIPTSELHMKGNTGFNYLSESLPLGARTAALRKLSEQTRQSQIQGLHFQNERFRETMRNQKLYTGAHGLVRPLKNIETKHNLKVNVILWYKETQLDRSDWVYFDYKK